MSEQVKKKHRAKERKKVAGKQVSKKRENYEKEKKHCGIYVFSPPTADPVYPIRI